MALATRCPACRTVFRIGTTQAAAKGGVVRCGVCHNVFNSLDALVRVEDLTVVEEVVLPTPAPASATSGEPVEAPHPTATTDAANALDRAPEAVAAPVETATLSDREPGPVPAREPEPVATTAFVPIDAGPTPDADRTAAAPSATTLDGDRRTTPDASFAPPSIAAPPEPAPVAAPAASPIVAPLAAPPTASTAVPTGAPTAAPTPPAPPPAVDDEAAIIREWWMPVEEPAPPPAELDVGLVEAPIDALAPSTAGRRDDTRPDAREIDGASPVLLRPATVDETSRGWRRVLALLSVVAALALLAQLVYVWRDELAVRWPPARPWLAAACRPLRCAVGYPAHPDGITIESASVQTVPTNANVYVMTALLRNRESFDLRYPTLELVLTDLQDRPILRRAFRPADYLAGVAGRSPDAGFPAQSELSVRIAFELTDLTFAGYRLVQAYP